MINEKKRKEVYFMEFPMGEVTAAVIAIVSYIMGLFTKNKKVDK